MKVALVRVEGSYKEAVEKAKQLAREGYAPIIVADEVAYQEVTQVLPSLKKERGILE